MPRTENPAGQRETLLLSAEPQSAWAGCRKKILTFTASQTLTGRVITFFHPDCNRRPRNCTGSCAFTLVGYTTGRDLHPAPKVGYATGGIIPFSVRAVKSYSTLLKLRSPLKRGSAGMDREKTFERVGMGYCLEEKACPATPAYPVIQGILGKSSRFENGGIGDRANGDALW